MLTLLTPSLFFLICETIPSVHVYFYKKLTLMLHINQMCQFLHSNIQILCLICHGFTNYESHG